MVFDVRRENNSEIRVWYHDIKRRSTCVACGESNPTCIEFHHKNGEDKDFAIGEAIANGYSKDQILREISKCIPLCVNCHRKLHYDKEIE